MTKFSKNDLTRGLTASLYGAGQQRVGRGARADTESKGKLFKEKGKRAQHAQHAGSAEGGIKAPPTPAPKSGARKKAAARGNSKQTVRGNRNGPSRRGRAQNAHSERAMRTALEVKARAAWRLALRRAESRKRKELVASVVEEVGGAPLSFVFEDLRARQARRDEQALIFGPSGRDEPVSSSVGTSDDRIGIEVAALVVEDGMALEKVRKVAREADATDDDAVAAGWARPPVSAAITTNTPWGIRPSAILPYSRL